MRAAVIEGGIVANIIEVESLDVFPNLIDAADGAIGDLWDGATFIKPPVVIPVPSVVTMRQARIALLGAGLLAQVQTSVDGMTGAEGEAARIEWEYAADLKRDHGLVVALAAALGLTETQIDELFIAAAGI
jgi:hypothetical protein